MERTEFRKLLFEEALKQGCEAAETYYAAEESFSCSILKGEVLRYKSSVEGGLNLRVKYKGKDGYAYTESMEEPEALVARAIDNAAAVETGDEHPMQSAQEYATIKRRNNPVMDMDANEKIELAKRLEAAALAADPLIERVGQSQVATSIGVEEIHNTLGLKAERSMRQAVSVVAPIAKKNERVKDSYAFRIGEEVLDVEGCADEAVQKAVLSLDASPCLTGRYDIVLENMAAADLLAAFSGIFSAEEAQKGRSLLRGKEGESVAADCVTIVDDPFHPAAPRAFDSEGTPARFKKVVENGVLNTLLHNLKTAKKAGVETTGNAFRSGAASSIGVGPTVFYIQAGETPFDELIRRLNNGLLITEIAGLHAGLDPVSGDFSLMASGRLVKEGKLGEAVDQITVAGNFLSFMRSVELVGSDIKETLAQTTVLCPSLLVRDISVAGK
ncbi:MAG: TldD/PmbA family protein [Clostridia bacterium]|nr:TldD/PmbA family protein [Clostridia bacterium]